MDKPTLYMETTIPSYLLAEPSRDVISLARQDITRTWWKRDQARYAIFISEVVIQEAGRGDRKEVEKRREFLRSFPVLDATPEVRALIKLYLEKGVVPPGNAEDAAHPAFASIHEMEYLCTWNFRHLANVIALRRLRELKMKRKDSLFPRYARLRNCWENDRCRPIQSYEKYTESKTNSTGKSEATSKSSLIVSVSSPDSIPNAWSNRRRNQSHKASRGLPTGKPRHEERPTPLRASEERTYGHDPYPPKG